MAAKKLYALFVKAAARWQLPLQFRGGFLAPLPLAHCLSLAPASLTALLQAACAIHLTLSHDLQVSEGSGWGTCDRGSEQKSQKKIAARKAKIKGTQSTDADHNNAKPREGGQKKEQETQFSYCLSPRLAHLTWLASTHDDWSTHHSLLWGSSPWPYTYEAHALPAELKRPCSCQQNNVPTHTKHGASFRVPIPHPSTPAPGPPKTWRPPSFCAVPTFSWVVLNFERQRSQFPASWSEPLDPDATYGSGQLQQRPQWWQALEAGTLVHLMFWAIMCISLDWRRRPLLLLIRKTSNLHVSPAQAPPVPARLLCVCWAATPPKRPPWKTLAAAQCSRARCQYTAFVW